MKKTISIFVVAMFLAGMFSLPGASAQVSGVNANVQALLQKIADLQKQVLALQEQLVKVRGEQNATAVELVKTLYEGSKGDEVRTLQALLAADSVVYPEGLITGYYGKLTAKAVKKFQEKNGIESIGVVGPKTLKKLNELLKKYPLAFENSGEDDDDDDKDKRGLSFAQGVQLCAIVPPGHLIAPGWLKKQGGIVPIIPVCQILPPGIIKKLSPAPTSTPDVTAPVISGIAVSVNATSALVSWVTNEPADSRVAYGTSTAYGSETTLASSLVTSHSQALAGLTASTTYHFQVKSKDAAGNVATSSDQVFTTPAASVADVTPPVISGVTITPSSTSAVVNWLTNELSDSQVVYGTSTAYNFEMTTNPSLVTSHSQTITGLIPSTTYHIQVKSKDAAGNTATSSDQVFATLAPPDTTAPAISGIALAISSTTAIVSWTTNESSTSKVYYSTSTPVTTATAANISNSSLVTSHSLNLVGLTLGTTYYFVVESGDAANNTTMSSEQSFVTAQ